MKRCVRAGFCIVTLCLVQTSFAQSGAIGGTEPVTFPAAKAEALPANVVQALNAFAQGNAKAKENNFNGAIADFSQAIALEPTYGHFYKSKLCF